MWVPVAPTRAAFAAAALAAGVSILAACGSSTATVTGPSGPKCQVGVANNTPELPAGGGNGSLAVDTSRDCAWSASAGASWISLSTTSGQGAATIAYSVTPNPNGTPRQGRIVVADQGIDVAQAAAPCVYQLSPSALEVDGAGGEIALALSATAGCRWIARTDVGWIGWAVPGDGVGPSTIRLTVAPNPDPPRAGTVFVGNASARIAQSAAGAPGAGAPPPSAPPPSPSPTCTYQLGQTTRNVGPDGEEFAVALSAPSGCAWTAASDASWISVTDGRTGSGNGSVRLSVAANSGAARTGTVRVAGETFTVQQSGRTCTYNIKPRTYHSGKGPDDIRVEVTTESGCTWTAASSVSWVTVVEGQTGSGSGVVRLLVLPNTGPDRSTTLTIAGQPFELRQNGDE